ncbi:polydiglycosylphosphate transferase PdtA [Streptomyces sannanensis]|uniref:Polydiglycosylphosphate transferase PdtA n=1 Tax=Streptomyces sannanensis TaxID=285536 RepID=A0ABP6S9G3_9ACTN
MNDQQHPYDPYYQPQPQVIGYDEYGQPVYQQPQQAPQQYGYDPYGPQQPVHDPYAQSPHPQQPQQPPQYGYGYGYGYDAAQQPAAVDTTQQWIPQQAEAPARGPQPFVPQQPAPPTAEPQPQPHERAVPTQRSAEPDLRTEQFSFVEDPDEDSEDVIDWLKFTESRTERREEARRRGRNRIIALAVALALVVVGGVGYLWFTGSLPGTSDTDRQQTTGAGPQKRDVIVVHLHDTKKGGTSTALLVDNVTTKQGTTVLLPNSLSVSNDDGTVTTLGKSVDDDGSAGTREALDTLLGAKITGTWRLDTPYLENLVELVGNIDIDTDTDVPGAKKGDPPLVKKGEKQTLGGRAAVAYATYRAPAEAEDRQLQRFGQVMYGVLRKISSDPKAATITIQTLAQILDPSLPESDLGASLAKLAEHAKVGDHKTTLLPVQDDGTLGDKATESVVKDILGGTVHAPEQGAAVRVGVKNASGNQDAAESARITLVGGGYSFVDSGKADTEQSSEVIYGDAAQKAKAVEVAKTLGLPESAVRQGKPAANADISVVLGQDYEVK